MPLELEHIVNVSTRNIPACTVERVYMWKTLDMSVAFVQKEVSQCKPLFCKCPQLVISHYYFQFHLNMSFLLQYLSFLLKKNKTVIVQHPTEDQSTSFSTSLQPWSTYQGEHFTQLVLLSEPNNQAPLYTDFWNFPFWD